MKQKLETIFVRRPTLRCGLQVLRATVEPPGSKKISDRHRVNESMRRNKRGARQLDLRVRSVLLIAIVLTHRNESSRLSVCNACSRIS